MLDGRAAEEFPDMAGKLSHCTGLVSLTAPAALAAGTCGRPEEVCTEVMVVTGRWLGGLVAAVVTRDFTTRMYPLPRTRGSTFAGSPNFVAIPCAWFSPYMCKQSCQRLPDFRCELEIKFSATAYTEDSMLQIFVMVLLCHSSECLCFVCNTCLCFGDFPCHFLFGCKKYRG